MEKEDGRIEKLFRRNDIRGIYGRGLKDDDFYHLGLALATFLKCRKIVIGYDMRMSSVRLSKALIKGILECGTDVINIGEASAPEIYFASGYYKTPAVMITASHNPPEFNGMKIVRADAEPVGEESGLMEIKRIVLENKFENSEVKGKMSRENLSVIYIKMLLSKLNLEKMEHLIIAVDAGNGMAGETIKPLSKKLPFSIIPLYFKLDGRFPNHLANPSVYKNLRSLMKKVRESKADFGVAFDGDVDRAGFVDENGKNISTSVISALLIDYLANEPGEAVVYNVPCGSIVRETAQAKGLKAYKEKVGHSYIKKRMKEMNAVFGCEHSGHYYFRDNFYSDSGVIAFLKICEIVSEAKRKGKSFSEILKPFEKYAQSEEINLKVRDAAKAMGEIEKFYAGKAEKIEKMDGLSMYFDGWWFNVRPSSNENFMRINLEAGSELEVKEKIKGILGLVKNFN